MMRMDLPPEEGWKRGKDMNSWKKIAALAGAAAVTVGIGVFATTQPVLADQCGPNFAQYRTCERSHSWIAGFQDRDGRRVQVMNDHRFTNRGDQRHGDRDNRQAPDRGRGDGGWTGDNR